MAARTVDGDDEIQKHSRIRPCIQFKEFSLTKQKLHLKTKNQFQNAACEQKITSEK